MKVQSSAAVIAAALAALALTSCQAKEEAPAASEDGGTAAPSEITVEASDTSCELSGTEGKTGANTFVITNNGNKDISSETLAEAEADWILYGAQKTPKDEKDKDKNNTELTAMPLWAGLKAVNDKHAVRVDDDAFFLNAGPTAARLVMTTVVDTLPKKK